MLSSPSQRAERSQGPAGPGGRGHAGVQAAPPGPCSLQKDPESSPVGAELGRWRRPRSHQAGKGPHVPVAGAWAPSCHSQPRISIPPDLGKEHLMPSKGSRLKTDVLPRASPCI